MNEPLALDWTGTVQSVVRSQRNGPLIRAAAVLWIAAGDVVVDVTYGRGGFWTDYRPATLIAHDIATDGVDFRRLPEHDGTVDVVVFDPPYIAQGGRDTSTVPDFLDRYGLTCAPTTTAGIFELVAAGMAEAARVLAPGGRLLVKCMDYVNGGELVLGHHHVVTTALALGLSQVDELVHVSGTGPQPEGRSQQHSRRAHTFLCVFRRGRWLDRGGIARRGEALPVTPP